MPDENLGIIRAIWRYPFKSMLGEKLQSSRVTERGIEHDRLFALRELATHKLATARQYPQLLDHRAVLHQEHNCNARVQIEYPDGDIGFADEEDLGVRFTELLRKAVNVDAAWEEQNPKGLFDDLPVHLLTTQTLSYLTSQHASSEFDPRRFRPNIVVEANNDGHLPEQAWIGRKVAIGDEVVLDIHKPCERCVMTTMPQEDLARDNDILKTVASKTESIVGVYATIISNGTISVGDTIRFLD